MCEDAGLNPVLRCALQQIQKLYINASVTEIKWKYKAYIGINKKSYFRDHFEKVCSIKKINESITLLTGRIKMKGFIL